MNIVQAYNSLYVLLLLLTLVVFWVGGPLWGAVTAIISTALAVVIFVLGIYLQRRIEELFKSH